MKEHTFERVDLSPDVTIYRWDCLDVLPTLGTVDCVVTSPPYNQLGNRIPDKCTGMWGRSSFPTSVRDRGYADDMAESDYQEWQNKVFASVLCKETASLFYNHQVRWRDGVPIIPIVWFSPEGWRLRQEIIWDRRGGMMMNARMFCRFDERILWYTRGNWKWNQSEVGHGTVWHISPEQKKDHPVAYPLEIPRRCISASTDIGDIVLDPFMGSGTTGVACIRTGRKFIGIEIDEGYFEIARKRLENELAQGRLFDPAPPDPEQGALDL